MWILRPQFEQRNQISKILRTRSGRISHNEPWNEARSIGLMLNNDDTLWHVLPAPHDVMETVVKASEGEKRQNEGAHADK